MVDESQTRALLALFPGARFDVTRIYGGKERAASGRHKPFDAYQMIELTYGLGEEKMHRYGEMIRAMLRDQLAWISDRSRIRKLTHENGRESLAMALEATRMAEESTES